MTSATPSVWVRVQAQPESGGLAFSCQRRCWARLILERISPDFPAAHRILGQRAARLDQWEKALGHFQRCSKANPGTSLPKIEIANCGARPGTGTRRCSRVADQSAGSLLIRLRDMDISRRSVIRARRAADARIEIAICLLELGGVEDWLDRLHAGLEVGPEDVGARASLPRLRFAKSRDPSGWRPDG